MQLSANLSPPCFILLSGSSGSGKSSVLKEFTTKFSGSFVGFDLDDCHPPKDADHNWWGSQVEEILRKSVEAQSSGQSVVVAGWTTYNELMNCKNSSKIHSVHVFLLDCSDEERKQRIDVRQKTGTWGPPNTEAEISSYLEVAHKMKKKFASEITLC